MTRLQRLMRREGEKEQWVAEALKSLSVARIHSGTSQRSAINTEGMEGDVLMI